MVVSLTDVLSFYLSIFNPALEMCALVVDETETAKSIATKFNRSRVPIFPFYLLKEQTERFHFDYVIIAARSPLHDRIHEELIKCKVPPEKIVTLLDLHNPFGVDRCAKLMLFLKQNLSQFKAFSTGYSCARHAIDSRQFELPTINCGRDGQDPYYDYKIAQELINADDAHFGYALIGLAPYSFHHDVSRTLNEGGWRLFQWFAYFRDLHNFYMSVDEYASLFRKEYLDGGYITQLPLNTWQPYGWAASYDAGMSIDAKLGVRKMAEVWKDKCYPKTVEENKKILDDYLTLCDQNEIKPILFLPPMPQGYMETYPKNRLDEFHVLLKQILSRHPSAVFFNGWQLKIFTDNDFCDSMHLNSTGSAKFSSFLNKIIMQFERK